LTIRVPHPLSTFATQRYGNMARLANAIGVSRQALNNWIKRDKVPIKRLARVIEVTGLSKWELRPDVYDAPSATPGSPG
jgi:DNA-binding transcriptional regulator YdaS (Cro superfamily)